MKKYCISCLQEIYLQDKNTESSTVREWKKIYHENANWKKTEVTILVSDKNRHVKKH